MKRIFALTTFVWCLFLNGISQTTISGGNVYGVWSLAGSPYNVTNSIIVPNDSTLTIQPGVIVNFQGHNKVLVLGRIVAIGSQNSNIQFTASDTTTGWFGFRYDGTSMQNDSSLFKYCNIQWAKANGASQYDAVGGAFMFKNFSKAAISHCSISHCKSDYGGGAIYMENSNVALENNNFFNNVSNNGGAVYCLGSSTKIKGNSMYNNICYSLPGGGAIACKNSNVEIVSNTFTNNVNTVEGGGAIAVQGGVVEIAYSTFTGNKGNYGAGAITVNTSGNKCEIYNNTIIGSSTKQNAGAVHINNTNFYNNIVTNNSAFTGGGVIAGDNVNITNNIIANNTASYGGGVVLWGTGITFNNNTIVNNNSTIYGGGILFENNAVANIKNCIIYGNINVGSTKQIYIDGEQTDPNFYYNNIEGGQASFILNGYFYTGQYSNNIDENPLFKSPSGGAGIGFNGSVADWNLQNTSKCINAGDPTGNYIATDLAGNARVFGVIDMGAYENQLITSVINIEGENKVSVYPNPASEKMLIQLEGAAYLSVYNLLGEKILCSFTADRKYTLDVSSYNEGAYLLNISTLNGISETLMFIVKK